MSIMKKAVTPQKSKLTIVKNTVLNLMKEDKINMIKGGDGAGLAVSLGNPCTIMTKP
jgi:hypothetical protein